MVAYPVFYPVPPVNPLSPAFTYRTVTVTAPAGSPYGAPSLGGCLTTIRQKGTYTYNVSSIEKILLLRKMQFISVLILPGIFMYAYIVIYNLL